MGDTDYGREASAPAGQLDEANRREITSHRVNGLNEAIRVFALDARGPGGANHEYVVNVPLSETVTANTLIKFQKGGIAEAGVNGLSNEALLAIVEDRLRGFASGPFGSEHNTAALNLVSAALSRLKKRTEERLARGVEGKSVA